MKRPAMLALAACAALSGCALGPDYKRPQPVLPERYADARDSGDGSAQAMVADWWKLYGNAELTSLVDKAMAANTDLLQAVARVELAEAQLREAGGALYPSLNGGANATRQEAGAAVPSNVTGRTLRANDYRLSLSASYELDLWGRLRRGTESARALALASVYSRDTVRLTVAGAVTQSWFALRSLDEQIAASRATLKTREDGLKLVGARVEAGTGSRLDAEQAATLRADAAVQLRDLVRQRALAQSQLALLTGDPALALPEAPLTPSAVPLLPPAGLPSALLERRPDVQRAEQQLVSANALIGAAKAAMFPTISLTGGLGQESTALSNLLDTPARFWSLGVGLTLPIFDAGRNAARVDQASARQKEAVGAYQSAVSSAFKDVGDALANLRAARESAADLQLRDTAASNAERLARARYEAGYTGFLELLDAQRTATSARLDLVRNRQTQLNASVDFIKALGGGWAPP